MADWRRGGSASRYCTVCWLSIDHSEKPRSEPASGEAPSLARAIRHSSKESRFAGCASMPTASASICWRRARGSSPLPCGLATLYGTDVPGRADFAPQGVGCGWGEGRVEEWCDSAQWLTHTQARTPSSWGVETHTLAVQCRFTYTYLVYYIVKVDGQTHPLALQLSSRWVHPPIQTHPIASQMCGGRSPPPAERSPPAPAGS